MAKKKQRVINPENQSAALIGITEIFIRPLLNQRPRQFGVASWLNFLFSTDYRTVQEFIATADFNVPGRFRVTATRSVAGLVNAPRQVRAGASIWVRYDSRFPDAFEVEAFTGRGNSENLYDLSRKQWNSIQKHLKPAPKRRRRRPSK